MNKLTWRVGGAQGSGVDTAANLFARTAAKGGWWVFSRREYYSNIMGRHSYLDVALDDQPLNTFYDQVDLLVAFDDETLPRHFGQVKPGGALLYDPRFAKIKLAKAGFLDQRIQADLAARLGQEDPSIAEVLAAYQAEEILTLPYDFEAVCDQAGALLGLEPAKARRAINTAAVAASLWILRYPAEALLEVLAERFRNPDVQALNQAVVNEVYRSEPPPFSQELTPIGSGSGRIFLSGAQSAALGKIAGGLGFQTYYPISPATDESVFLEAHADKAGSVVIQTEDEIAAITMAIGAALTGARAATATSGPGFSLMAEGIGWAGMNETPVVVTVYQRGGPSTGLPTRTEQGDLQFALHAGHGDFPKMVLASADVEACFYDAVQALNLAEEYQLPVMHLIDKYIANSSRTYLPFDQSGLAIRRGEVRPPDPERSLAPAARFMNSESGISPRIPLGTPGGIHWLTGNEHDAYGHVTEDSVVRVERYEKRMRKLTTALERIPASERFNQWGEPKSPAVVVGWGSVQGPALAALAELKNFSYLQIRLLWPFSPEIEAILTGKRVIVMEHNYSGQLADLIAQETGIRAHTRILKYNGRPISAGEAKTALSEALGKQAPARLVLYGGV